MVERLSAPEVDVTLQLDPLLAARIGDSLRTNVRQSIERELNRIMAIMGISGAAAVEVAPLTEALPHDSIMHVRINGERCRFSEELVRWVLSYAGGRPPVMAPSRSFVLERIAALAGEGSGEPLAEFLSLLCAEVVKLQPGVLFGADQAEAYSAALAAPGGQFSGKGPLDPAFLRGILTQVLNLRISIADRLAVAEVFAAGGERTEREVIERLIETLQPDVVEIQMRADDLRQMTTSQRPLQGNLFTFLREGMFTELGVRFPEFRLAAAPDLKPNTFAFSINHLPTQPWVGIGANQCLVNDSAERMRLLNVTAEEVLNPASNQPGSLVDLAAKEQLELVGLTTW